MANTRQAIINAVDARLKTITVANGYSSNLGTSIYRWRQEVLSYTELPGIVYRDTVDEVVTEGAPMGSRLHRLTIAVECFAYGTTTDDLLRGYIGDVVKAIGVDHRWGGLARHTELDKLAMELEDHDEILGGVVVEFSVAYYAPLWEV